MIRAFLFLLLAAGAGWFVADSMKQNGPGYVLVYYNHYSLETSVWVGILLLFLLVLLCYALIRLLQFLLHLSWKTWGFRQRRQRQWFDNSVAALLADDWAQAAKLAARVPDAQNLLIAGRAALNAGNTEAARAFVGQAATTESANNLPLLLLHYDIERTDHQAIPAEQLLKQLLDQHPEQVSVLQRAVAAYVQGGNAAALQKLLPQLLKKMPPLYAELQKQLLAEAGQCLLQQALQQRNVDAATAVWLKLGKTAARNNVLPEYCRVLIKLDQHKEAEKLLLTRLQAQFDEQCLVPYAMLPLETQRQLDYLQAMNTEHPFNGRVQLALGIVLLRDQQWDAARKAIEKSIEWRAGAEAYRYLSLYYERRGDERHARQSLMLGLEQMPR